MQIEVEFKDEVTIGKGNYLFISYDEGAFGSESPPHVVISEVDKDNVPLNQIVPKVELIAYNDEEDLY